MPKMPIKDILLRPLILTLALALMSCSDESGKTPDIIKPSKTPPFEGTIFLDPDIITDEDPTTFQSITYAGQGLRTIFDRRPASWITVNAFLFNVVFDDGLTTEVQVNPEFNSVSAAQIEADKYARLVGQLPKALRRDVDAIWINAGVQPFGGGNNSILIHTEQSINYEIAGILEETLVHEASHTSLDADHANTTAWRNSQILDGNFISTYARDYPTREDISETFLLYMAIRYRASRISSELKNTVEETIPNRIIYLDNQVFDMYPIVSD